jgi:hypothetical protein
MKHLENVHWENVKVNSKVFFFTDINCGVGTLVAVNLKVLQFPQNV